jgi:hypothetical protein
MELDIVEKSDKLPQGQIAEIKDVPLPQKPSASQLKNNTTKNTYFTNLLNCINVNNDPLQNDEVYKRIMALDCSGVEHTAMQQLLSIALATRTSATTMKELYKKTDPKKRARLKDEFYGLLDQYSDSESGESKNNYVVVRNANLRTISNTEKLNGIKCDLSATRSTLETVEKQILEQNRIIDTLKKSQTDALNNIQIKEQEVEFILQANQALSNKQQAILDEIKEEMNKKTRELNICKESIHFCTIKLDLEKTNPTDRLLAAQEIESAQKIEKELTIRIEELQQLHAKMENRKNNKKPGWMDFGRQVGLLS